MHVPQHFTGIWALGKLRLPGKSLITLELPIGYDCYRGFKRSDRVAPLKSWESSHDTIRSFTKGSDRLICFTSLRWTATSLDDKIQQDKTMGRNDNDVWGEAGSVQHLITREQMYSTEPSSSWVKHWLIKTATSIWNKCKTCTFFTSNTSKLLSRPNKQLFALRHATLLKQAPPSPPSSLSLSVVLPPSHPLSLSRFSQSFSFPPIFLSVTLGFFVAPQSWGLCRRFPRSICGIRHGSLGSSQWRAVTCPMGELEGGHKEALQRAWGVGVDGDTARGILAP